LGTASELVVLVFEQDIQKVLIPDSESIWLCLGNAATDM
jgi:hypothetical protein